MRGNSFIIVSNKYRMELKKERQERSKERWRVE